MAAIQRVQDLSELMERVGAKLDLVITPTSTPNDGQVCGWMNEAALLLAMLLPPHRLGSLQAPLLSSEDVGETLDLSSTDLCKTVGVKKYGVECTVLDQRTMDLTASRFPLRHTVRNPAVCISGDSGDVQLQFWPTSPGPVEVKGIQKPTAYIETRGGSPEDYTWAPDAYSLPVELERGAIDYTVIQGRVQDEEPEQVALLFKMWSQSMGIEAQVQGLGVD